MPGTSSAAIRHRRPCAFQIPPGADSAAIASGRLPPCGGSHVHYQPYDRDPAPADARRSPGPTPARRRNDPCPGSALPTRAKPARRDRSAYARLDRAPPRRRGHDGPVGSRRRPRRHRVRNPASPPDRERIATSLAAGHRIVAVSHAPARHILPSLVARADMTIRTGHPTSAVIRDAIREATGIEPEPESENLGDRLDSFDFVGAIQVGRDVGSCLRRLGAAGIRHGQPGRRGSLLGRGRRPFDPSRIPRSRRLGRTPRRRCRGLAPGRD